MWKRATHKARMFNVIRWLAQIQFIKHTATRDEPRGRHEIDKLDAVWRDTRGHRDPGAMVCLIRRIRYKWYGSDEEYSVAIIWKNGWSYKKLREVFYEEVLNGEEGEEGEEGEPVSGRSTV